MSSTDEPMVFLCPTEQDTRDLGRQIGLACPSGSVVSLRGPLGAGKTVVAKGVADALGITEAIVSPTFTFVQEYAGTLSLRHMDLYRIDSARDFESIGGEELLYTDGITLIEWSEKIDGMLGPHTIYVNIEIGEDSVRRITVRGVRL